MKSAEQRSDRERFMGEAVRLAREGMRDGLGGPFGAVVVRDGQIVGRGSNSVVRGKDPTAHAEINALRDACAGLGTHLLAGCEVYTSCEPCPMCLAALYWARVDRVWYAATRGEAAAAGFDDELIYGEMEKPPERRLLPLSRILGGEGARLFDEWMDNPDRIPY